MGAGQVHRLPVGLKVFLGAVAANRKAKCRPAIAEGRSSAHPVPRYLHDQDASLGDREAAIVDSNCADRLLDPRSSFSLGSANAPGAKATSSLPPPTSICVFGSASNAS